MRKQDVIEPLFWVTVFVVAIPLTVWLVRVAVSLSPI